MIVVADASPINYLVWIGAADVLQKGCKSSAYRSTRGNTWIYQVHAGKT